MTKRRLEMSKKDASGPKKGPSAAAILACVVLSGFTFSLALNSNAYDRNRLTEFADLTLRLPEGWLQLRMPQEWKSFRFDPPQMFTTTTLGNWPNLLVAWNEETRSKSQTDTEPAIAIVIDDLGVDSVPTRKAINLPPKVTLSFLPYPDASHSLSHQAYLAGHEIMVHLPMQPLGSEDPGPMALKAYFPPAELTRRVDWALQRVSDYAGANNHMGSNFTASRRSLVPVMQELAAHNMFFLDSRTTPTTQAEDVAREAGMLTGSRDIFLDDDESALSVEHQLKLAEERARANGIAIAIGHPHPETLAALKVWAAKLSERGFRLVPVSEALQLQAKNNRRRLTASFFN